MVVQSIDGFKKELEKFLEKTYSKTVKYKVVDTILALKCPWIRPGKVPGSSVTIPF